jgi:hypothetical protein
MPKRKLGPAALNIVPHPRFDRVVASGYDVSEEEIRKHWGYQNETIFPESAIPANVARQNCSVVPRQWYVDVLKRCRDCKRPFIFFAREQQHWFEELGFWINADCVRCVKCRKSDQKLRSTFKRYSDAVTRRDLDDKDLATHLADAVLLFEAGILRDEQRLRRLRNLGRRRIPNSPELADMDALIFSLKRD